MFELLSRLFKKEEANNNSDEKEYHDHESFYAPKDYTINRAKTEGR